MFRPDSQFGCHQSCSFRLQLQMIKEFYDGERGRGLAHLWPFLLGRSGLAMHTCIRDWVQFPLEERKSQRAEATWNSHHFPGFISIFYVLELSIALSFVDHCDCKTSKVGWMTQMTTFCQNHCSLCSLFIEILSPRWLSSPTRWSSFEAIFHRCS